jgi:hypothetical protein
MTPHRACGFGSTSGPARGGQRTSYGGGRFALPVGCATTDDIRQLAGFSAFAAQIRELREQTALPTAEILDAARRLGVLECTEADVPRVAEALDRIAAD